MKHAFFDQLHIPEPDIDLEVGSGTHAQQTADIMKRFEPVLDDKPPDSGAGSGRCQFHHRLRPGGGEKRAFR